MKRTREGVKRVLCDSLTAVDSPANAFTLDCDISSRVCGLEVQ